MSQKISKPDWDAFIADDELWQGLIYEDPVFEVDGKEVDDVDPDLPDTSRIRIKDGVVMDPEQLKSKGSLAAFYRKWLKKQNSRRVVVEIPSTVTDQQLLNELKAINGNLV